MFEFEFLINGETRFIISANDVESAQSRLRKVFTTSISELKMLSILERY